MKIFGSIGRIGSGKDEVVKYLNSKYGIPVISIGDLVREMTAKEGLALTRENLHHTSQKCMQKYGKDYFMNLVLRRIQEKLWKRVGVTGIRTPNDIRFLKNQLGDNFVLFHIYIDDPQIRYERIKRRKKERDPQNYQDFLKQDRQEEAIFHISEAASMANFSLDNNGSLKNLYWQIDKILENQTKGLETSKNERSR